MIQKNLTDPIKSRPVKSLNCLFNYWAFLLLGISFIYLNCNRTGRDTNQDARIRNLALGAFAFANNSVTGVPTLRYLLSSYTLQLNGSYNIVPEVTGNPTECKIAPPIPNGMQFQSPTCILTGAPSVISSEREYTITASNSLGSASAKISLSVIAEKVLSWRARTAAEQNSWQGVTYGNGLFVAVSSDGTNQVMTSPDGITWTSRSAAEANSWQDVTYGNGLFVAVSSDGNNRVMTSPDGITWTARAVTSGFWKQVVFGNGTFLAVGTSGPPNVMTSTDGINWTNRTGVANSTTYMSVAYSNNQFVAVTRWGDGFSSMDGTTWTQIFDLDGNNFRSFAMGNGVYVVGDLFSIHFSPNTTLWTQVAPPSYKTVERCLFADSMFVCSSPIDIDTTNIYSSVDGIIWKEHIAPEANRWTGIAFGNGMYVVVSKSGNSRVTTSR